MSSERAPEKKKGRKRAPRYGIGQWMGRQPQNCSRNELISLGEVASQDQPEVACPFSSALGKEKLCGKSGGVCSIRAITADAEFEDDTLVTTCPDRFLEDNVVLQEVGKFMLGADKIRVARELPFLKSTNSNNSSDAGSGRIDWVVQDAEDGSRFCGVEFQSMYFSGARMQEDFEHFQSGAAYPFYPAGARRPDYRSSGPKRLAPQLSIKVPMLDAWDKSMAVVIDRYFLSCMDAEFVSNLPKVSEKAHRQSAVGMIVVDYDQSGKLVISQTINVDLDPLIAALNSSKEMTEQEFVGRLADVMSKPERSFLLGQ